jgi:Fe-S oxidoreductase
VQDLKRLMTRALAPKPRGPVPALHGETITAETLWSCTACSACVDVCPVRIDPLNLILDLRRHLVGEGGLGGTAATALRRIVAHCPHCMNVFLKDYPQLGGSYEVMHHTQLLAELIRDGKLTVPAGSFPSVTYHDPCYLARVNGIASPPREVLNAALNGGGELREMPRHGAKSFCCGAGGGRMWMEEDPKQRVSTERAQEALATGAAVVGVACPFCLTMMSDGVAAQGAETRVMDVAEILAERLGLTA